GPGDRRDRPQGRAGQERRGHDAERDGDDLPRARPRPGRPAERLPRPAAAPAGRPRADRRARPASGGGGREELPPEPQGAAPCASGVSSSLLLPMPNLRTHPPLLPPDLPPSLAATP